MDYRWVITLGELDGDEAETWFCEDGDADAIFQEAGAIIEERATDPSKTYEVLVLQVEARLIVNPEATGVTAGDFGIDEILDSEAN